MIVQRLRPLDLVVVGRKRWTVWPPTPSNLQSYSVSTAIQEFTDSDVNHVGVITSIGFTLNDTMVVEASYPRVRCVPLAQVVGKNNKAYVLRHPGMTPERERVGVDWLNQQVDEPYDVTLIAMMIEALKKGGLEELRRLRIRLVLDCGYSDEDTPWICSELAVTTIHQTGLVAYPGYDATAPVQEAVVPTPDDVLDSGTYLLVDHVP